MPSIWNDLKTYAIISTAPLIKQKTRLHEIPVNLFFNSFIFSRSIFSARLRFPNKIDGGNKRGFFLENYLVLVITEKKKKYYEAIYIHTLLRVFKERL
jgi:hypothetical protein